MAKQPLDSLEVEARQQQVTRKSVPEGVRGNAFQDPRSSSRCFDRTLYMRFMKMITAHFTRLSYECEHRCGKKPLPDGTRAQRSYTFWTTAEGETPRHNYLKDL